MNLSNLKAASVVIVAMSIMSVSEKTEKTVDVEKSNVSWKAYKVTGEHEGTIKLKSGTLDFENNDLAGGTFVIDMSSISVTDLEGDMKGKLDGHLKSADFFGVEEHPESSLVITNVSGSGETLQVTADLTIKGITEPITFPMTVKENKATAELKIDRANYDVRYGSNSFFDDLKDKAIYDEFDLKVDLTY
ncbi:Polyisoprenoid-binding protein YceI [Flavobacteriaceae bacterium MAR_2010_188]|nr:Polyisoprenoid-binding protein YceI [Flavobacteriaceae bacterium MAR_2010_188]